MKERTPKQRRYALRQRLCHLHNKLAWTILGDPPKATYDKYVEACDEARKVILTDPPSDIREILDQIEALNREIGDSSLALQVELAINGN